MKFLKYVLATIVGLFTFFAMLMLVFLIIGGIASALGGSTDTTKPNSVLYATFGNPIVEKADKSPFGAFNPLTFQPEKKDGLNDLVAGIAAAKDDDNVKGIFMELQSIPGGFATVEAIRNELLNFKESGKFIYTYGELYSQQAYYLASVADSVFLNPQGIVDMRGFGTELMFFKNALDKLEIEAQVFKVGGFKSAVEPFTLTQMSENNRLQIKEFLNDFYGIFLEGIAVQRGITTANLNNVANDFKIRNAEDAMTYQLVDKITYKNEALNILKERLGLNKKDKLNTKSLSAYAANASKKVKKGSSKNKIAVVYAFGGIVDGPGKNGTIGSLDYEKIIRKLREKDNIKAIVLRVNSGGGSALASDVIWHEIEMAKDQGIPVVVSMGDLAASGGYYIACNSDYIFAEENTITGSIGVFGLLPNMKGFFNNKMGITFDTAKTTEYADFASPSRAVSTAERAIIQQGVNDIYDTFLSRVAEGRNMTVEAVHEVAQGRVWSGLKAKDLGLVDEIGNLGAAITKAAELADLEAYKTATYPVSEDPLTKFLKELQGQTKQNLIKEELGSYYTYYKQIKELIEMEGVQMRLPYEIIIQ